MVATLDTCMAIVKMVALPLKEEGLPAGALADMEQKTARFKTRRGHLKTFLTKIQGYIEQYKRFLGNCAPDVCTHESSDIIESIFGKYKPKANNYALTRLTRLNLELPLFCKKEKEIIQLAHSALEGISITCLGRRVKAHSADNQLVRKLEFRKS